MLGHLVDGTTAYEVAKELQISLKTLYDYLDRNPKFKDQFNKAQERGIKTLVEKMCVIFNSDVQELSNEELLFLREKQNWLKFIAPRLSSLFIEKTKQEVKQDTTLRVMWEDNTDDLIDVSAEDVSTPTEVKD
jgi:transposase